MMTFGACGWIEDICCCGCVPLLGVAATTGGCCEVELTPPLLLFSITLLEMFGLGWLPGLLGCGTGVIVVGIEGEGEGGTGVTEAGVELLTDELFVLAPEWSSEFVSPLSGTQSTKISLTAKSWKFSE